MTRVEMITTQAEELGTSDLTNLIGELEEMLEDRKTDDFQNSISS